MEAIKAKISKTTANNLLFYTEGSKNTQYLEDTVTNIFNVVILISMFLCFFSLSASTTANLYDQ